MNPPLMQASNSITWTNHTSILNQCFQERSCSCR